jgi:2-alkyl-3-oxoalkanoate reductase
MRIIVTGATGVLGRRAVPALVAAGHEVTAVSRRPEADAELERVGARPVRVDLFDPAAVTGAVQGHEAVASLATAIPPLTRAARPKAWAVNDRLRREAVAHLVDAALATGVGRFVQESICFPYADGQDAWVDEEHPVEHGRPTAAAADAEASVARLSATGASGVALRFAQLYAHDASHTRAFNGLLRRRIDPFVGPAGSWVSSVHAEDAGAAVVAALGAPSGIYNVGDDEPMRRVDAGRAAAAALGLRPPRRPPQAMLRLAPASARLLMRSIRVDNRRFRDATGWAPGHRSIATGWATTADPAEV